MFLGIQILGALFILIMIYFTLLNYKKNNYGSKSFIGWLLIWVGSLIIIFLPNAIYGFMNYLNIERTQDFFFIGAFVVLFVIVFNMYVTIKKTHAKVEKLVRENALSNPISKKIKNKK
jgi:hypothetical protein